jgi:hypothetical protein
MKAICWGCQVALHGGKTKAETRERAIANKWTRLCFTGGRYLGYCPECAEKNEADEEYKELWGFKFVEIPDEDKLSLNAFEINVSRAGKHVFATHARSCKNREDAIALMKLLVKKFRASEGYSCELTGYSESAHLVASTTK